MTPGVEITGDGVGVQIIGGRDIVVSKPDAGFSNEVVERDRRAEVGADIERFTRAKSGGHGTFDRRVGHVLAIYLEDDLGRCARFRDGSVDLDLMAARRKLLF